MSVNSPEAMAKRADGDRLVRHSMRVSSIALGYSSSEMLFALASALTRHTYIDVVLHDAVYELLPPVCAYRAFTHELL